MHKTTFSPHKTAIFAIFIFGETGILIPYKNGNDKTFLGFLISIVLGGAVILLSAFLLKYLLSLKGKAKKYLVSSIFLGVAAYGIYLSVNCFDTFIDFVSIYVLPQSSRYLIGLIFFATVLLVCISKTETFYKLGLVTAVVSAALLIVLFIFSVPQFDADNVSLLSFPKLKDVISQSLTYLKSAFLPLIILPFFELLYSDKNNKSRILNGFLLGVIFLTICILNSLLIFGSDLSAKLDFPYSEAIATVTAGNIFTRMDGFSYFVFFVSCLAKITLCIKLSAKLIKSIAELLRGNCSL